MDVLISWSKKQSREMASVFHGWLPKVVPGFKPWMSSKDIDKGKQWFGELQGFLGEATSCIICVTAENVRSPWIYYETGAIAAKKQDVLVCPYLVGIGTGMVADGPLAQYQCTEATKEDTLHLIKSLNNAIATPHDEGLLCGNFENKWPEFEAELNRILNMATAVPADFVVTDADAVAGYKLTAEARTVLLQASNADGVVQVVPGDGGREVIAGGGEVDTEGTNRSRAKWGQAVRDLVRHDLLIARDSSGEMFDVTARGYEVAEVLQKKRESGVASATSQSAAKRTFTMCLNHAETGHCEEGGFFLTVFEADTDGRGFEGVIGCPGQENMEWQLNRLNSFFRYDCGKKGTYEIRLIGSSSDSGSVTRRAELAITRLDG